MTSKPLTTRMSRTNRMNRTNRSSRSTHQRRAGALLAGALLLGPALSACGFNYATDRVNTISAGTNDRSGSVDVLGAVVIADSPDTGVFVATLANNDQEQADALTSVSSEGLTVSAQPKIDIAPGGHTSLIAAGGIGVVGSLVPGQWLDVQLGFAGGQSTTVKVNVVRPCFQYSPEKLTTLKFPTAETPDATASPAPAPGGADLQGASTAEGDPDPYGCDKYESTIRPDGHAPESEHGSSDESAEDAE